MKNQMNQLTELEYPLMKNQLGIYFDCLAKPDEIIYYLPFIYELDKPTDIERLKGALVDTINAHPYLKTTLFVDHLGEVKQRRNDQMVPIVEIEQITEEGYQNIKGTAWKPFQLHESPLYFAKIYETETKVILHLAMHHLILDGTSMCVFLSDLKRSYLHNKRNEPLQVEQYTAFDAALEEEEQRRSENYHSDKQYYEKLFEPVEVIGTIPPTQLEKNSPEGKGVLSTEFILPKSVEIEAFCKEHGITKNVLFTAAYGITFLIFQGLDLLSDSIAFSTVYHGRTQEKYQNSVGMFVRTLPVVMTSSPIIHDMLVHLKEQLQETRKHTAYSFDELCNTYGNLNEFQFVYQGEMMERVDYQYILPGGKFFREEKKVNQASIASMSLEVIKHASDRYQIIVEFKESLFDKEWIQSFVASFETAVVQLMEYKECSQIHLFEEYFENKQLYQNIEKEVEKVNIMEDTIIDMFQRQVAQCPNNIYVVCEERSYTYQQTNEISECIASYLEDKGLDKDDVVAILIHRNEYMALASIGIMKTGATYQPLDPGYPEERLSYMLKDSGAKILITERAFSTFADKFEGQVLYTDEISSLPRKTRVPKKIQRDDRFVLLYTSGSTGQPKGVQLLHKNLMACCSEVVYYTEMSESTHFAAYVSFGFDAHLVELFSPILKGASIYIINEEIRLDLGQLNAFFHKNNITTTCMTTQVGRQFYEIVDAPSFRDLISGGEALSAVTPREGIRFWNTYGPTECNVAVTYQKVDKEFWKIPIGTLHSNMKAYVLNKYLQLVPYGAIGELVCAGPQISKGYLKQEERTKEVFVPNPFSEEYDDQYMYRTGDYVRLLPDGTYEFFGRRDTQVKIRGYRIELSEIESTIRKYEKIQDCTVKVFEENGNKIIVAYLVSEQKVDVFELKNFISNQMPSYMVPDTMMQIEKIPLTQNHKVNVNALPKPTISLEEEYHPPQNAVQRSIQELISDIIGKNNISITSDIFENGLTSISAMRLLVQFSRKFHVNMTLVDLRQHVTIKALEDYLSKEHHERVYDLQEDYPLMKNQLGIYIECKNKPDHTFYQIPLIYEMPSTVDVNKLEEAVKQTIQAHPYMKTTLFTNEHGQLRQKRQDHLSPIVTVMHVSDSEYEEACKRTWIPLELDGGRLYQACILVTEWKVTLLLQAHHVIADGASFEIFMKDLVTYYSGAEPLEKEICSGYWASLEEEERCKEAKYQEAKNYYAQLFADIESYTVLPPTKLEKGLSAQKGLYQSLYQLNPETQSDSPIEAFCREHSISESVLFTAAYGITLQRFLNEQQAVFTTIYNGRNDVRLAHTFCMLVKTLPVCMPLENKISALLQQLKQQLLQNMEYDMYSFAEINAEYGITSDLQFVYQGDIENKIAQTNHVLGGKIVGDADNVNTSAICPMLMQVNKMDANSYEIKVEFQENLYHKEWMESFVKAYQEVVSQLLQKDTLDEILLSYHLSSGTSRNATISNSANLLTLPIKETILHLFLQQVRENPMNPYIIFQNRKYTYHKVDSISNQIASYLLQNQVKQQDVVAVLLPRNEYMAILALGIWKVGAAYLPLDLSYPEERLNFMLQDTNAKILLTEQSTFEEFSIKQEEKQLLTSKVLFIDDLDTITNNACVNLPNAQLLENLAEQRAVILYTSGSTGTPKGAELLHKNIASLCFDLVTSMDITQHDRFAAYASFSFDVHTMDLYAPIVKGASTYIVDEETRLNFYALEQFFNENKITIGFMTTQVARQFFEIAQVPTVRHFMAGGEALLPVKPRADFTFWNIYGPTECTVYVTKQKVDCEYTKIPLGYVNPLLKTYIVDGNLNQVPNGAIGELLCAGPQVANGYLNDRNKQAFIQNPFSEEKEYSKAYRTGDYVRRLPDGRLEFFGRSDKQVKIRGFRIELAEVESAVRSCPQVQDATVHTMKINNSTSIVAYIVSDICLDGQQIKDQIRQKKPSYMVPDYVMQIDKIPLTPNHKVDKRALPIPEFGISQDNLVLPSSEMQIGIHKIVTNIIGKTNIGIHSDLFESGLTSISAMQLIVMLMKKFETDITINDLRHNPTIALLETHLLETSHNEAKTYQKQDTYPLLQNQLGIYIECMSSPERSFYQIPFIYELDPSIDLEKFESAVKMAIDAHPYLKTRIFVDEEGNIRQKRMDEQKPVVSVQIISDQEYDETCQNLWVKFNLDGGILYQAIIVKGETKACFLFQVHHVIADGTSIELLIRDIYQCYQYGEVKEKEIYTGYEVALEEEANLQSELYEQAKNFYHKLLKDVTIQTWIPNTIVRNENRNAFIPQSELGQDVVSNEKRGFYSVTYELAEQEQIDEFCKKYNISENVLFTAAYGVVLQAYQGVKQAVFTTIYSGRNHAKLANTFCMLVKTLPICMPCETDISKLLHLLKEQMLQSIAFETYSFAEISATYGVSSDLQFVYQGDMIGGITEKNILPGSRIIEAGDAINTSAIAGLCVQVVKRKQGSYQIDAEYRDSLYSEKWIAEFMESYQSVITQFTTCDSIQEMQLSHIEQRKVNYINHHEITQELFVETNKTSEQPTSEEEHENTLSFDEVQQELIKFVGSIMGNVTIDVNVSLFQYGMTSIQAMRLVFLCSKAFQMNITMRDLREHNTIEQFGNFLSRKQHGEVAATSQGIQSNPSNILEEVMKEIQQHNLYPLTQTQLGILTECIGNPKTTIYNVPILIQFNESIDVEKLKEALVSVLNAHSYLKITIVQNSKGDFVAKRNDEIAPLIQQVNHVPDFTQLVQPFELMNEMLYRVILYVGTDKTYLFMDFHHMIFDGSSLGVLYTDLEHAYMGGAVIPETYSGFDRAVEEVRLRETNIMVQAKEYYDKLLKGCEVNYLPSFVDTKCYGRGITTHHTSYFEACREFCETNHISLNTLLMTAFGFLIAKYKYSEEAVFTTIYSGRDDSRTERTVNMLVKTLPMYLTYDGDTTILDVCKNTSEQYLSNIEHDIYSFAEISHDYGITSDLMFCCQVEDQEKFSSFAGKQVQSIPLELDIAKMALSLNVVIKEDTILYVVEYEMDKYTKDWTESFLDAYEKIVSEMISKKTWREVELLSDREYAFLKKCNDTFYPVEPTTCNLLLEKQVSLVPDKIAVTSKTKSRTYRQLNENANRIAWGLMDFGVKEGEIVAFMLPRDVEVYEVREGIMKAGAAFLCISPDYADERIRYILENSNVAALITTDELQEKRKEFIASSDTPVLSITKLLDSEQIQNPNPNITPDSIAYCIYTSGSTGKPKGVLIYHKNLVNYTNWNEKQIEIDTLLKYTTMSLAITAFTFDVSVLEECVILYNGLSVCIANEEEICNPFALAELILEKNVDALTGTPAFLATLIEEEEVLPALRNINVYNMGGEQFTKSLLKQVHAVREDAIVLNVYGPTETTIGCTAIVLEDEEDITIGKPLTNMEMYMVDRYQHILPSYMPGEMMILGDCVGKGYIGMPEVAAEKFVQFLGKPAYHSGDLAYWRKDERIAFIGRIDQQVKLRGLRVELGEIESVITSYEGIHASVVLVWGTGAAQYLCAYYTAAYEVDKDSLTRHMETYLTDYMIPRTLVQLDEFELTANGKINKKVLQEPKKETYVNCVQLPKTALQQKLMDIFTMVLKMETLSITDDFFELGGTSLLASKLVMKCMSEGYPLVYADIFTYKTIVALEAVIMERQSATYGTGIMDSGKGADSKEEFTSNTNMSPTHAVKENVVRFATLLSRNTIENLSGKTKQDLGRVLLTGATGFLGIHVLKEYLDSSRNSIYCFLRETEQSGAERLKQLFIYYFSEEIWNEYADRICFLEGDITNANEIQQFEQYHFDLIINCAACVKHFVNDDILKQVNVQGVKNLVDYCKNNDCRLVQISTVSVGGEMESSANVVLKERDFDIGQSISNAYVKSKYLAEELVLQAAEEGLKAQIIRVGNLMGRQEDGKFQINSDTNGFIRQLLGYTTLGKIPVSMLDMPVEFSPIDMVARAVLCCSGFVEDYTICHAYNTHSIYLIDVIQALNHSGYVIDIVSDEVFGDALRKGINNDAENKLLSGLISYMNPMELRNTTNTIMPVLSDNSFTTKLLYQNGFYWPITDEAYLCRCIADLKEIFNGSHIRNTDD